MMHFIFFAENANANLHNLKMLQSEINFQAVTATDHLPKNILCQKNKAKKIKTKKKQSETSGLAKTLQIKLNVRRNVGWLTISIDLQGRSHSAKLRSKNILRTSLKNVLTTGRLWDVLRTSI